MTESDPKKLPAADIAKTEDAEKKDKKKRADEFLKMVNSKLKKSERETWMLHDHDHLFDDRK
ncbi:hypothetical protein [Fusibacter ferrireducens]|uniref:Uncharacterized protein n=1 Tax=Fusibacter ferrireducens TaxID=2785058 RepID=A0ABR9ZU59_9FIRM|nr:hypothetical protein [Fusibacter ferrireducens]MBF4693496.1 hypothetical protein [Fusibacter ferrireducens]